LGTTAAQTSGNRFADGSTGSDQHPGPGFLIALSVVAPSFQAGDLIKLLGVGTVAIGFAFQNMSRPPQEQRKRLAELSEA
jgi:hypothetical protein